MARIGFAYNQRPPASATTAAGPRTDAPIPDDDSLDASALLALAPDADDEFAEWDDPATIDAVEAALRPLGEVIRLEAVGDFAERLRRARVDIVFNIAEGLHGPNRESHIPAICEFLGVPYTASDPFTLALCLDKARTKEALSARGVRTAPWVLVQDPDDLARAERALPFPVFAKPVHEGSSKGITERSLCRTPVELHETGRFLLERYRQPVLVERYLAGEEFTAAVLGNGRDARVLPVIRMNFASLPEGALPIYGFEAKWVWDVPGAALDIHECPAPVDARLLAELEHLTLAAYRATGCRDWARVDLRLDDAGVPHVVEINPLPGIMPDPAANSCLPMAARTAGLSYEALIQAVARLGAERCGVALAGGVA
ncbi:MAG: D-alanine--D-alanine ligase [Gemmatimonadetes bacterium]|nr:D-alanine--D-alanine ligase [Gemmatimonadota bacterium]